MSLAFLSPALQSHALRDRSRPGAQAAPELSTGGVRTLASVGAALLTFAGAKAPRLAAQPARVSALDQESLKSNNKFAFKMVKICVIVTLLPFLFCIKNFFYDRSLSDFDVEYGPHLAHPALRTTSILQAVMVFAAVMWREKYRSDPIDRLFAWLFVPEAIAHILLHWFSHHHAFANFAFAYAFSAGIALPGFLSLLCYVPKEKKLPWAYLALYVATQIPIVAGLTNMVGPAKMRLNYANINTAWITTPFFYGILKRWRDVPKSPVVLATLTISYQVAMGIMGPITGGSDLKLYDPSCIFQHGVVDIGFGLAYAVSIVCGVFRPKVPVPDLGIWEVVEGWGEEGCTLWVSWDVLWTGRLPEVCNEKVPLPPHFEAPCTVQCGRICHLDCTQAYLKAQNIASFEVGTARLIDCPCGKGVYAPSCAVCGRSLVPPAALAQSSSGKRDLRGSLRTSPGASDVPQGGEGLRSAKGLPTLPAALGDVSPVRLPAERAGGVCPNCLKEESLGFGAVCMTFKTFICHDCKSAHQSFSHRCKSVQMSVWTMDEVKAGARSGSFAVNPKLG
ncbi:unnamed protein product [Effrenium voratum]|uniref:Uncharacterized protein n=1 Tax=Effrenium voratum TaxID=2562239 RepID=A0AA36IGW6_9DINO|nr:unnamed protein product [Effrenium voratum]